MKKTKVICVILLLFLSIVNINASSFKIRNIDLSKSINNIQREDYDDSEDFIFNPIDVQLEDDAYHGIRNFHSYEWWYFDAMLDNGYCIQLSIRVLNILNKVLYTIGLNIYKDGQPISNNQEIYFNNQIFTSTIEPLIFLEGKEIMKGYIDEFSGDWIYNLDLDVGNTGINLTFVGDTKGWKGLTPGIGWWGVFLPHAKVSGDFSINGIEREASGYGYHDHNWEVTISAGVNFGWYWGKIHSSLYTITWADVKMTRFSENPFIVINKKDGGYTNIPLESIQLNTEDLTFSDGKLIPESFRLIIDYNDIYLNIYMDVFEIHHFRRFGFINYWRYHLSCNGFIKVDENIEDIHENTIAEFLRFR